MLEIERKFFIDGFPNGLPLLQEVELEQGYLSIEPEIRLHRAKDIKTNEVEYWLTLKGNGGLVRTEDKTRIEEDFYFRAVEFLQVPMIQKEYKCYQLGAWILEVTHVDPETSNAFFYAEIEFPTEEAACAFQVPEYLGKEITLEEEYKMKNYWKRTRL